MYATWTLAGLLVGAWLASGLYEWWVGYEGLMDALLMPRSPRFRAHVGAQVRPLVVQGQVWRVPLSALLHADPLHLGVNVVSILTLGRVLEPWVGALRFAGCFVFGALAGAVVSHVVGIRFTDGASAGAFALLGAVLVLAHERRRSLHPDDRKALGPWLWGFAALNVVLSFALPFVNAAGHVGGLAAGLLFAGVATRRWSLR